MKIAYFDTFSGISGDMVIGAFINAGLPLETLQEQLNKLSMSDYQLNQKLIKRNSISATLFEVNIKSDKRHHHEQHSEHHYSRSYKDIIRLINESELKISIKERAIKIFDTIATAESKIHSTELNNVHFHEIGAIDSIVDILGYSICIEEFGIEKIYTNIIPLGKGFVKTQHGLMPIPAPATIEILRNYPVVFNDIPFELTTPTGAGIISATSSGILKTEKIKVDKIGYGAGTLEIPQIPNLLRLMIGEFVNDFEIDECIIVETNIDDMNPEFYPYVIEKLLSLGVHDAYIIPIIMKKGRPGILLSILAQTNNLDEVLKTLYRETTTLGVRILKVDRRKIPRQIEVIETPFGKMRVKISDFEGKRRITPEYEECKRIASERKIPISEVYNFINKMNM